MIRIGTKVRAIRDSSLHGVNKGARGTVTTIHNTRATVEMTDGVTLHNVQIHASDFEVLSTPATEYTIPCVGCDAPLVYRLDLQDRYLAAPMGAIAYAGGHLCPECARAVEGALRERRFRS